MKLVISALVMLMFSPYGFGGKEGDSEKNDRKMAKALDQVKYDHDAEVTATNITGKVNSISAIFETKIKEENEKKNISRSNSGRFRDGTVPTGPSSGPTTSRALPISPVKSHSGPCGYSLLIEETMRLKRVTFATIKAKENDIPSYGSITRNGEHVCSGVFVYLKERRDLMVTEADCVKDASSTKNKRNEFKVKVGVSGSTEIDMAHVFVLPMTPPPNRMNPKLALVLLAEPLAEGIQPICPPDTPDTSHYIDGVLAGPKDAKQAQVNLLNPRITQNRRLCRQIPLYDSNSDRMFCTLHKDIQPDLGSSFMTIDGKAVLHGIVTTRHTNGVLFTRLWPFIKDMEEQIEKWNKETADPASPVQ